MARKVVTLTEFFDDFDGEKIDDGLSETIEFAVQGTSYRMDLRRRTPRGSVKTLKVDRSRSESGRASQSFQAVAHGSGGSRTSKEGLAAIRNWAADNGYHVSTRGRIAREIVEAFEAAH
ncbi:Lsr2 family protein [Rhodococcus hoagii]|nr:Lsr2 family protein [Prescottella equi]